jgi:hypothetical protein
LTRLRYLSFDEEERLVGTAIETAPGEYS